MKKNGKVWTTGLKNGAAVDARPLISCVILKNTTFPSKDELLAAIKNRVPEFEHTPLEMLSRPGEPLLGMVDGKAISIESNDQPITISPDESFIKSAWWWPTVQQDLEPSKAHAIITLTASEKTVDDHALLARLTAAVVEINESLGIIWDSADAVWQTYYFLGIVNQAEHTPPFPLFVSVKLGQDTQYPTKKGDATWMGMTSGLAAFGLMELEMRGFEGQTPEPMVDILQNIASYLISARPAIKDGDTMDVDDNKRIKVQIKPSTLASSNQVYRIYLD